MFVTFINNVFFFKSCTRQLYIHTMHIELTQLYLPRNNIVHSLASWQLRHLFGMWRNERLFRQLRWLRCYKILFDVVNIQTDYCRSLSTGNIWISTSKQLKLPGTRILRRCKDGILKTLSIVFLKRKYFFKIIKMQ